MPYLQPDAAPAPIQGKELNRFVQQWMMHVIGVLPGDMIRTYDQSEPPVVPAKGEAWMAFSISVSDADWTPVLRQTDDGTELKRQETLRVLCNFYDTGVSGYAMRNAGLLRDSGMIPDNLEGLALEPGNLFMVGFEDPVVVPSLLSTQWLYRVDLTFRLRRQIDRKYSVPNIEIVDGVLKTDVGLPDVAIHVEKNP